MAAITPSSVLRESLGSVTLHIAQFAGTADTTDTWASGIPNIVAHWVTVNDTTTTQASQGAGATVSGSTFSLFPGEDNTAMTLFVLSRT